ncbi:MAG TPA: hypothetical protein VJ824_11300 [Bacillota bacterium]|nr:hypothetical protein [Bacillota bacterium]
MKILEVTSKGFTLTDNDGKNTFVNLEECNEHWVMYNKRRTNWSEGEWVEFQTKSKYVGQRDICANPPFYEFFTKPFTRIEIHTKEEFEELKMKLLEVGWTTIDLS